MGRCGYPLLTKWPLGSLLTHCEMLVGVASIWVGVVTCPSHSLQTDPMPTNKMTALTVHLPFVGFTFTHNSKISDNPPRPLAASADSAETGDAIDSSLKDENCRLLAEMESLKKQATTSTSSLALGKGTDGEL